MTADPGAPVSLRSLEPLWVAVRRRLDRYGAERRGTIQCPQLTSEGRLALASLLAAKPSSRLRLDALECALVERGFGADLDDALAWLGHPASLAAADRRATSARTRDAHRTVDAAIAAWSEPWATDWAADVRRAGLLGGLDAEQAAQLIDDTRRFLDREGGVTSRTELAASLFGSAHALDPGARRRSTIVHALRHVHGPLAEVELWDAAGVVADRVSAPVLVWNLPTRGDSALDRQVAAARDGSLPVHLTLYALQRHPVAVAGGSVVHIVENPRLVEAAAERDISACVIAANGNPSRAVTFLLRQLLEAGAVVRYHGDFDAAGIAMCARMRESGATPWLMGAEHYWAALADAERLGLVLPLDSSRCAPTAWDPPLADTFNADRRIVHEELIIDGVLAAMERDA